MSIETNIPPVSEMVQRLEKTILDISAELNTLSSKINETDRPDDLNKLKDEISLLKEEKESLQEEVDNAKKGKIRNPKLAKYASKGLYLEAQNLRLYPLLAEVTVKSPHSGLIEKFRIDLPPAGFNKKT